MDAQLSNETAFEAAGADAVHKALHDNIVLLEPMMKLEVTVPEEFLGPIEATINGITTLDQAEAVLRKGIADTIAALDALEPEQTSATLVTPIGPQPFRFFMDIPARHLFGHTAQIDYLQTCWGDQEVHL